MAIKVNGRIFYRTREGLARIGISRATWLRWVKQGLIKDVQQRDRNGWRLFTDEDIDRISQFAYNLSSTPKQEQSETE